MEGFETRQYSEVGKRDAMFGLLRREGDPNERQVVRYSNPEPVMVSEEEFKLNDRGRVVYADKFYLAYPKEVHGHRARRRAKRAQS